jgi:hypothetical protein
MFTPADLREVEELLGRADEVVAMREIAAGEQDPMVVGLRHDVDNHLRGVSELANWEREHGWRATYFILHDSPYWNDPTLPYLLDELAGLGHEIGIHVNAIAEALTTGKDPAEVLDDAIERLADWGHPVIGSAAHGDRRCYRKGEVFFVNDEMFTECARPEMGAPKRKISPGLKLDPKPLAYWGLQYDSNQLSRSLYLSESGGSWRDKEDIVSRFPTPFGQLHILMHPCWWVQAFTREEAAA